MKNALWEQYFQWKKDCRFVELTHEFSPETPHWSGFSPMEEKTLFTHSDGFFVREFKFVSQYGTHVDAPIHFVEGKPALETIEPKDMILPLCVIDVRKQVEQNVDYAVTAEDIIAWESENGQIPEQAFVAILTDWSKREDMDNCDENNQKHYPAWGLDALKYLVEQRNVTAIGHETSDTDPGAIAMSTGFACETYILDQGRYQIELLNNLSEVPSTGALIFCGFPKGVGSPGFPARCIAICPK